MKRILALGLLWVGLASEVLALTETEQKVTATAAVDTFEYKTVQTKEGLNFRVPADMPIETKDGIQAPIPLDQYVYGKFKKAETRLNDLEKRVAELEQRQAEASTKKSSLVSPS